MPPAPSAKGGRKAQTLFSALSGRPRAAESEGANRKTLSMATKSKKAAEVALNSYSKGPDDKGFFGMFGGRFVAETLMPLIIHLERAYNEAKADPEFRRQIEFLNLHYAGRPSPLYHAERMTNELGGAKIYFKRDELNHTGSHKINNCIGQILLAKRMGKTRIIAETG